MKEKRKRRKKERKQKDSYKEKKIKRKTEKNKKYTSRKTKSSPGLSNQLTVNFFKKIIFIVKMNFTLLKIYHSESVQYLSF